jgi:hypothetical protein
MRFADGLRAVAIMALTVVFAPAAPGEAQIFGTPPPATPTPSTIVGRMGDPMSVAAARRGIAFSPFVPPRQLLGAALIPPFHGDDVRDNRGIAIEYLDVEGRRYALAQWPAHGRSIAHFPALATAAAPAVSRGGEARTASYGRQRTGGAS